MSGIMSAMMSAGGCAASRPRRSSASPASIQRQVVGKGGHHGSECEQQAPKPRDHAQEPLDNRSKDTGSAGSTSSSSTPSTSTAVNSNVPQESKQSVISNPHSSVLGGGLAAPEPDQRKPVPPRFRGVKLDFKSVRAIRPAIDLLLELRVPSRVPALFLNADVIQGPASLSWIPVIDGPTFIQQAARIPQALVSLSWLAGDHAYSSRRGLVQSLNPLRSTGSSNNFLTAPAGTTSDQQVASASTSALVSTLSTRKVGTANESSPLSRGSASGKQSISSCRASRSSSTAQAAAVISPSSKSDRNTSADHASSTAQKKSGVTESFARISVSEQGFVEASCSKTSTRSAKNFGPPPAGEASGRTTGAATQDHATKLSTRQEQTKSASAAAVQFGGTAYSQKQIDHMLGLVLFPLVDDGSGLIRSPANALHHITFAVCAQFALASKPLLHSLLQHVPSASFTFFSGSWSRGISYDTYAALRAEFPKEKCFFDVKIADMQRPVDNILKMLAEEEHQNTRNHRRWHRKTGPERTICAAPTPHSQCHPDLKQGLNCSTMWSRVKELTSCSNKTRCGAA